MKSKFLLPLLAIAVLVGSYLYQHRTGHIETTSVISTSTPIQETDTAFDNPGYILVVQGEKKSFYCKLFGGYEGAPSCQVFMHEGGAYMDTGLSVWNPSTTLLVSPDKAHILLINGAVNQGTPDGSGVDSAIVLNVSDGSFKTIYEAPKDTWLGVLDSNINFYGRARWIDSSKVELKVYAEGSAGTAERNNGMESEPIKTVVVSI